MFEVKRVPGGAQGRSAGSAAGGFAWAVTTADDPVPDIYAQTKQALLKLDGILAELGTDKTRLVNATVYVDQIGLKPEMDRAWCEWIGDDPTALAAARLRRGAPWAALVGRDRRRGRRASAAGPVRSPDDRARRVN